MSDWAMFGDWLIRPTIQTPRSPRNSDAIEARPGLDGEPGYPLETGQPARLAASTASTTIWL